MVGHVDTWTAWELSENVGTINAVDFLGHNGFPYFETTTSNPISNALTRFNAGLSVTEGVAGGKPV
jgi:glucan endo-1,3-beta-D-glucosidase